jgi:hypothetical protein
MTGVPNIPLGIGPPNVLSLTLNQGDSSIDLTTVTAVVLNVVRTLDGSTARWACAIASKSTTSLVVTYAFQQPAAPGTFAFTNGQPVVTSSVPNAVPVGALLFPSSQPGVFYAVSAVSGTAITLSAPYAGTTNAAATATYTIDVNVLGTYDVAPAMTVPTGVVPGYAFQLNAVEPQQCTWRTP